MISLFMDINIFSLKNKKVLVIGGSGLIGVELSNFLNNLGATVFNLDIKKNKGLNKQIKYLRFDVTSKKSLEIKINNFLYKYGVPDCYVNCSYPIIEDNSKYNFKDIKLNTIKSSLDIHLKSYIWLARIVAEKMIKSRIKGSIVQFGSHYGVIGQNTDIYAGTKMSENMVYSAIKGGIINNTRQMAVHYGKYGIRVNCISPGGVDGHVKGKNFTQPKSFLRKYSTRTPLKRLAKKNEIAPAVAFLLSDASTYITGINLMIDGGWTAS